MSKDFAKNLIAMTAPVEITAAEKEGENKGPAKFSTQFYTGGALELNGWDLPVVIDLAGLTQGNVLVANLDHDRTKRVGNFALENDGKTLVANGTATARTSARDEVVGSALDGYQWQSSLEVSPAAVEEVASGKTVEVNGQTFTGPLYVTRKGTLKGFAFVSHGADDNTTVSIAATAASTKEQNMDKELKAWIEELGFKADELSETQLAGLKANYEGQKAPEKKTTPKLMEGMEAKKAEADRVDGITEIALNACDKRPYDIDAIKELAQNAIDSKWGVDKFRLELLEASLPSASTPFKTRRDERLNSRVLEAAVCVAGRLDNLEKSFDDQTLQEAHDRFRSGIGLNQLLMLGAEANGYSNRYASQVTLEVQRAAFGMLNGRQELRASGFSTVSIPNILSNVANKFLMQGWNAVDMTPLRIAKVRPVRDFKTITTVSLTGDLTFEKVGAGGEIAHGNLGEETYSNKADTYARMLAITRTDFINDDLGALTDVPMKLGRGSALKLNNIFWTAFLDNSTFFTSGRNNVNTAVADMTTGGLTATETIFMDQTDPDGNPLGIMPKILLVPTPLKTAALQLMNSEKVKGDTDGPDANIFKDRFRVESSPYMSNSAYTGYSAAAWYMLADPMDLPVIEIAALNGRVEPVVETADAEFNVLGVQMRGYSDVGVAKQEYRAGVRADGGAS